MPFRTSSKDVADRYAAWCERDLEVDRVQVAVDEIVDRPQTRATVDLLITCSPKVSSMEDEVTEFVGRSRYERADSGGEVIYRNGFAEPSTVRTTSGPTVIERPRVRDATKVGFESEVLGKGVARTHALEGA